MINYFILLLTLSLTGCSTTSFKDFFSDSSETPSKRNEALMKDFEVKKKVLEKFKETETNINSSESPSKKKIDSKTVRMKPEPKPVKSLITKKTIRKKKIKKTIAKKKVIETLEPTYPEDYPERLKVFDQVSAKFWKEFKPVVFQGEKTVLDISYMGVSTGQITIETKKETKIGTQNVHHLHARIKTADFYSYLYELDDYCDSYVRMNDFKPLKFSLIQRQSAQNIDDLQLFDHEDLKTYTFYKRVTDEKTKKNQSVESIPLYFQDPLSIVYFVRGLPMDRTRSFEIPIVNKGKVEILKATIGQRTEINTKIGKRKAVKVLIQTKHKGKTIEGGKMAFWYSDDEEKIFLKFEAKIKIGSVSGEIRSFDK